MLSDISLLSQENIVSTVLSENDYSALSSQGLKKHSCIWNIQHILSSMPLKCRCCFFAFTLKLSQQAFKYQQVNTMWNCGNKTNTSSFIKTLFVFSQVAPEIFLSFFLLRILSSTQWLFWCVETLWKPRGSACIHFWGLRNRMLSDWL